MAALDRCTHFKGNIDHQSRHGGTYPCFATFVCGFDGTRERLFAFVLDSNFEALLRERNFVGLAAILVGFDDTASYATYVDFI